jgi:Na+/H+ antiporter NhaD/arsenite permease-like protein
MLWIDGQVSTVNIILKVFLPSLFSIMIPLLIITFFYPKSNIVRSKDSLADQREFNTAAERTGILMLGVGCLLFVPVFKTLTHLPPFMGMLLGLGVLWVKIPAVLFLIILGILMQQASDHFNLIDFNFIRLQNIIQFEAGIQENAIGMIGF